MSEKKILLFRFRSIIVMIRLNVFNKMFELGEENGK